VSWLSTGCLVTLTAVYSRYSIEHTMYGAQMDNTKVLYVHTTRVDKPRTPVFTGRVGNSCYPKRFASTKYYDVAISNGPHWPVICPHCGEDEPSTRPVFTGVQIRPVFTTREHGSMYRPLSQPHRALRLLPCVHYADMFCLHVHRTALIATAVRHDYTSSATSEDVATHLSRSRSCRSQVTPFLHIWNFWDFAPHKIG